jgi:hypothetical protein
LQLIADKFPWFVDTYRSYPHNIQRADVLRYFVLYEYGGIYLVRAGGGSASMHVLATSTCEDLPFAS